MSERFYTLNASCPDQVGIIAKVTGFFAKYNGWILSSHFFADETSQGYFMRLEVRADFMDFQSLKILFEKEVAQDLKMRWQLFDSSILKRVAILVSKQEHCLFDLFSRWRAKDLNMEMVCVISNHPDFKEFVEWHKVDFHYIPINENNKREAYFKMANLIQNYQTDALVLARYMQILNKEFCAQFQGKIINIHHSFLPSFIGAKPYHQAYQSGVKLIGATCHYVTEELDKGPIIEQDIIRIDHSHSVEEMILRGKDIEKNVLARGLNYHLENRVLIANNKTIVFK